MKEKNFAKALDLRGPEFSEMLHGFRAIASIAREDKKLPASKVRTLLVYASTMV